MCGSICCVDVVWVDVSSRHQFKIQHWMKIKSPSCCQLSPQSKDLCCLLPSGNFLSSAIALVACRDTLRLKSGHYDLAIATLRGCHLSSQPHQRAAWMCTYDMKDCWLTTFKELLPNYKNWQHRRPPSLSVAMIVFFNCGRSPNGSRQAYSCTGG